jgi:hypothetical protein
MTQYLLSYHGGDPPKDQADGERVTKSWVDWLQAMGKAVVTAGNPTTVARTIAPGGKISDGGGPNPVTGWTVLEATDMDAAIKLAKGCPQLKANGSIEVSEVMSLM